MKDLNFIKIGDGEPVIILHGLFGMLDNWQTFGRMLSADYGVFLVDQRNHGRSPHLSEHTYATMAMDLKDWMESQGLKSAHIIGHSMGGKTAMAFALEFPFMARSIISIDMGVKGYESSHEIYFEAMRSLPINEIETRSEAEEHLRKLIPEDSIRLFLMKNIQRNKDGSYQWKFNLEQLYKDYEHILEALPLGKHYDKKALFVSGKKSGYIRDEDLSEIQTYFPRAEIKSLDTGHWVHAEKPIELHQLIVSFLKSVSLP